MRSSTLLLPVFLCLGASLRAVTATSLASFEGLEQPKERYVSASRSFQKEDDPAISDLGGGAFRMALRYSQAGWDGDRDTGNRDRQRAEVKGLGPHQKIGETFEYETTWRVDASFHGTTRFFHVFQLKATEGDDGAPLITMSLERDPTRAAVHYWSGKASGSKVARTFSIKPGEWTTVRIRVKTSFNADGEILVSVNGDPFTGVSGLPLFRTDARDYRPKWGMYRGVAVGMSLENDYVEHRNVSASPVSAAVVDNTALETEALKRAAVSIPQALSWLQGQPASPAIAEAMGSVGALWEQADPQAALDWALTAPVGAERPRLVLRLYDRWQTRDIGTASAWIIAHAPNPDLDPALWYQATDTSFRHGLKGKALSQAGALISDPAVREKALEQALARWAHEPEGVAGAKAFVDGLPSLSADEKTALQDAIDARPAPTGTRKRSQATEE